MLPSVLHFNSAQKIENLPLQERDGDMQLQLLEHDSGREVEPAASHRLLRRVSVRSQHPRHESLAHHQGYPTQPPRTLRLISQQ